MSIADIIQNFILVVIVRKHTRIKEYQVFKNIAVFLKYEKHQVAVAYSLHRGYFITHHQIHSPGPLDITSMKKDFITTPYATDGYPSIWPLLVGRSLLPSLLQQPPATRYPYPSGYALPCTTLATSISILNTSVSLGLFIMKATHSYELLSMSYRRRSRW